MFELTFRFMLPSDDALHYVRTRCTALESELREIIQWKITIQRSPKAALVWVTICAWSARGRWVVSRSHVDLIPAIDAALIRFRAHYVGYGLHDAPASQRRART